MKTFNYNLPPWETKNKSMVRSLTSTYMFLMHRLQYVMSVIMITVLFGTFQTALKKVFTQRFNPFYRRMLVMNTLGGKLWLKVNIFNYLRITLLTTDQWSANKKSGSGSALLLHWSLKQICGLFDCLFSKPCDSNVVLTKLVQFANSDGRLLMLMLVWLLGLVQKLAALWNKWQSSNFLSWQWWRRVTTCRYNSLCAENTALSH